VDLKSLLNGAYFKKGGDIVANKNDNLIPQAHVLTLEEQSAGGIASGKARQEKATMRKTLEMLLNEKNNKGKTYRELSTLGLIKGAVDGKAENYKIMLQLLGELVETQPNNTPELKIEIVNNEELEKEMY
jgi:ACT domain-containing protein